MKILFLDVDGVLNYAGCKFRYKGTSMLGVDPDMVAMVRRIVRDTGCKIVMSSSWRHDKESCEWVAKKVGGIIDITPTTHLYKYEDKPRGTEIYDWLSSAKGIECYAILDDDSDFHEYQPLFKTDWNTGLTPEITQQVIDHLNGVIA